MHEASINHALFPDDRAAERLNPAIAGHPDLVNGSKSLTVHAGMTGLAENAFINTNNQSHSITAIVDVPAKGTDGALLVQGGRFGGWAMYVNNGKPFYTYNWLRLKRYSVTSTQTLKPGKDAVVFDFAYDGGGPGKGGAGTTMINGHKVGSGRIDQKGMLHILTG